MSTEEPSAKAGRLRGAVVTKTGDATKLTGNNAMPVEDYAKSYAPQTDREEAPVTAQEGKDSEVAEALVMRESLPAASPVRSDRSPVSVEKEEKKEASENKKIAQPASSDQDEKVEQADMPEKPFPAAQNIPREKKAPDLAQIKKSEKKPDISTEKKSSATDNKTVIASSGQRGQENELTGGKMSVPAKKHNEPEREVTAKTMLPPAGSGHNGQQELHQKAGARPSLPMPAEPETRKEVTVPSGTKDIIYPKLPDVRVSSGPNLSVSAEKPLQGISLVPGFSPEMTLPTPEEKTASQASEKVGTTNPPAVQAQNAEKNDNPKGDLAMTKQNAETAGKIDQPKAIAVPGEAHVKEKGKSAEVEEELIGKDHSLAKGKEKASAVKKSSSGVRDTQKASPSRAFGGESKPGHKKNAGVDKTVVNAPTQTVQKPAKSGVPLNDPLKQAHDPLAGSVEIGAKKPGMGQKADDEKDVSSLRLGGGGTDKNHQTLQLASKILGQSEALKGSSERSTPGTEVKPPASQAAVEGPVNAGGSVTKFDADTTSKAQSSEGKTTRSEAKVSSDPGKETEENRLGIPVSEALIQKDIKIEVALESADMPAVLTQLFRKSHPKMRGRRDREKQETVEGTVETRLSEGADKTGTRLLAVTKAEKGVYTFVLENKGTKARTVDILFRFYEGRERERDKNYNSRELAPGRMLRFTFLMPEGIFWDDDDRFSGRVEDSRTITKFDSESGLVWKEEKEH